MTRNKAGWGRGTQSRRYLGRFSLSLFSCNTDEVVVQHLQPVSVKTYNQSNNINGPWNLVTDKIPNKLYYVIGYMNVTWLEKLIIQLLSEQANVSLQSKHNKQTIPMELKEIFSWQTAILSEGLQ